MRGFEEKEKGGPRGTAPSKTRGAEKGARPFPKLGSSMAGGAYESRISRAFNDRGVFNFMWE